MSRRLRFVQSTAAESFSEELRSAIMKAIEAGADLPVIATALVAQLYGCGGFYFKQPGSTISAELDKAKARVVANMVPELADS